MPIPTFDSDGSLPEGNHECSLDEIHALFGTDLIGNVRSQLFSKLVEYVHELKSCPAACQLLIDGSFATSKVAPNDIDLIVVLAVDHDFQSELRPFEYNALSRRRVSRRFAFDLLVARQNSAELQEYVEFFQLIRGNPFRRKGLLKVQL